MNQAQNFQAAQTLASFRSQSTRVVYAVVAANGALVTWSVSRAAAYREADKRSHDGDLPHYVQKV